MDWMIMVPRDAIVLGIQTIQQDSDYMHHAPYHAHCPDHETVLCPRHYQRQCVMVKHSGRGRCMANQTGPDRSTRNATPCRLMKMRLDKPRIALAGRYLKHSDDDGYLTRNILHLGGRRIGPSLVPTSQFPNLPAHKPNPDTALTNHQ